MTRSFHWRTTFWTAGTFLLLLTLPMAMFSMSQKKKPKTWICFVSPALHQCIWETWSKFGSEAVSGFCDFVTQGLMFHSFSEKHRSNTVDWLRVSYESYVCDHICVYIYIYILFWIYLRICIYLRVHIYIYMRDSQGINRAPPHCNNSGSWPCNTYQKMVVTWPKADASFPDKHGTQLRKLGGTKCTSEIDSTAIQ